LVQHKRGSSTSGNGRVEWERKSDKTERKTERKHVKREDIHRQLYKTITTDTEETKNHRERRKKERERSKNRI
jgi:hypothetical protein